ncbi:MAG: hypothetical protein ABEI06_06100 [Halobacteriaceae archaeon]
MREFDKAVGKLMSCCSTMGASFRGEWTQNNQQRIMVRYRGTIFTIFGDPADGYFTAFSVRQLTNIDGYEVQQSQPIVQIENEINDLKNQVESGSLTLKPLTVEDDAQNIEYFDGFRAREPLFVFDDDFSTKEFDETLAELNKSCRSAFDSAIEMLDIDIDEVEESTGEEDESRQQGTIGFQ